MKNYVFDHKKYKASLKNGFSKFFPITLILIIMLIGVISILNNNSANIISYTFVKVDSFTTYSSAISCSENLSKQNAKPLIHFDNKYHVLIGYYTTKKQAENVVNKLMNKYSNADIFTLSFEKFNGKNSLSKNQNKAIFDLTDCIENTITTLNNSMTSYERNEISITEFKAKISKIQEEFNDKKDSFFSKVSKPKFHTQRNIAENISKSIYNIKKSIENEQDPTINTRYEIMELIINYSKFCTLF